MTNNNWKLFEMSAIYTQDSDSNADNDLGQTIELQSTDAGDGPYIVIKTDRWAIDNVQEIIDVLNDFKRRSNQ